MLDGEVELDDALVGAMGNGKHGRGTDQQQVIVAVETGAREAPGRACVRCVPDCSGGPCELFAPEHVSIRAQARADARNGIRGGLAGWPGLDQGAFEESGPRSLPAAHHVCLVKPDFRIRARKTFGFAHESFACFVTAAPGPAGRPRGPL